MNKTMIIALTIPALAACAGEETDSADGDAVETTADAPETDHFVDRNDMIAEETPQTNAEGSRLRVGPDGAEIEIREGNVDANVSTDRDPSIEVEF